MERIMQIFYGNDFLPYKDKERTIHYPIVGNTFNGMNNVNELHFYVRDIGGVNNLSWVAIAKLPNGRILYELLTDVRIDHEIEENYVVFNVSQFYTQLKGEVYISLNGCSGEVEIETDEETGISTISGEIDDNTVVATGSIKLAINYAPQRPLGFSFDVDQYQNILNALANKSGVFTTIQVVATLPSDLTGYNDGQLFYCSGTYYELVETSGVKSLNIAEQNGLLGGEHALLRYNASATTQINSMPEDSICLVNYGGKDYLYEDYEHTNVVVYDLVGETLYIYTGQGTDTFGDVISNTNAVKYLKQVGNNNVIYATNNSGEQTTLSYSNSVVANAIVRRNLAGQISVPLMPTDNSHATSKKYVDDKISEFAQNELQTVDTTTYPTLQDFLETTGVEGYIYLYPIDATDLTKGYYRYIWENNSWLALGTTEIDLSDYYTKNETNTLLGVKVDKTNQGEKVYGTDELGSQKTYSVDSDLVGDGEIVRRNSGTGTVVVGTPASNTHATTKGYVDANFQLKLVSGTNIKSLNGQTLLGSGNISFINYIDHSMLSRDIGDNFESVNLFDKTKVVNGGYFSDNGTISSQANSYYSTQYISVKYGKTYVFSHYSNIQYPIATYDKNGNFLARINHVNSQTITFNSNVAFIRLSIYNTSFNANFMLCEQGKVPTTYQDYKLWFNLYGVGKAISDNFLDNESQNPIQNATITNKLFDANPNVLVTNLTDMSEEYAGYGGQVGSSLVISLNSGYKSYYLQAKKNMEIYVDDTIPNDIYYSICVGRNATNVPPTPNSGMTYYSFGTNTYARYRNSENNLPTENNKLSINAGDIIVFSFTPGYIGKIVGIEKQYTIKKSESEYTYSKTTNELDIETPHAKYVFKLVQNQSTRIDTWRLYAGYLKKPDGSLFEMWSNTDAEGVVRIDGEEDFIGGYHGDETMTALKIFVDGVDITSETNKSGSFEAISIYVNSDVYHCNTSSTPNVVAFKRSKQLVFEKDKWTVSNGWTAQENISLASTPLSLFQCDWKENSVEIPTNYSTSPTYKLYSLTEALSNIYPSNSKDMTEFYLETIYANIQVKILKTGNNNSRLGQVAHKFIQQQNRIKFYYYNIIGESINNGDILTSQFEVEIK